MNGAGRGRGRGGRGGHSGARGSGDPAPAPETVQCLEIYVFIGWQSLKPYESVFVRCCPVVASIELKTVAADGQWSADSQRRMLQLPLEGAEAVPLHAKHLSIVLDDPTGFGAGTFDFTTALQACSTFRRHFAIHGHATHMSLVDHEWEFNNCIKVKGIHKTTILWPPDRSLGSQADPLECLEFAEDPEENRDFDVGDGSPSLEVDDGVLHALGQEFYSALSSELEAFKRMARVKRAKSTRGSPPAVSDDIFVQKTKGAHVVFKGSRIMGRVSFPIHWYLPCVSGMCLHPSHGTKCRVNLPCDAHADEHIVAWISRQDEFLNAEDHLAERPQSSQIDVVEP